MSHNDEGRRWSRGQASRPLFGALPIARLIPQDLHSVIDYLGGAAVMATALLATDDASRLAAVLMGLFGFLVSLITDYRLSLAKLIPIEVHQTLDYSLGAVLVAAPFLFDYWRVDGLLTWLHVLSGLFLIVTAPITDYRGWSRRAG